jgi:probable F420-dependent oxidoreductase
VPLRKRCNAVTTRRREKLACPDIVDGMKYGLAVIYTPDTADPATVASKAEALGFDSVWYGEHPVIPVNYTTPYPLTGDGRVPPYYHRMCDPLISLAAASAVTSRIKLATGICLIAERNPLLLAKEVATLDHISSGRVILGIGAGYFREEAEVMGTDFRTRYTRMRESVEAMRKIWTEDEAEYRGKVIEFPAIRSEPKPASVPVHLGGLGERALRRVATYADGWCPVSLFPAEQMGRDFRRINDLAAENGRKGEAIEFSVFLGITETTDLSAEVERWREAGASRLVLSLGNAEGPMAYVSYRFDLWAPETVERTLEGLAKRCGL